MRPKLVLAVSLLAALGGAGSCIAIVFAVFSSFNPVGQPGLLVIGTLLLPLGAIVFGSVFVYRHTARKRKLQAFLTAILATMLTLTLLVTAAILSSRRNNVKPPEGLQPPTTG